ncbi:neprilysin-1-like [Bombus pascuorum]|uniref:neprilysin-1-like n=1 Tax=Bombus pascuorum TaxID=65598 RepID=UPI00212FE5BF|nr:neprilysin-1-like [Bombus pascuorum]
MISRGSYQIANMEAAKAARQDQSYRSCVLSLIIFFFLCMILILASLPWKLYRSYNSEEKGEYAGTIQHHYHEHHTEHETERTTSTTERTKLLITTTSIDEMNSIEVETETTLNFEVFTENSRVINDTNLDIVDSSKSNIETATEDLSQTETYKEAAAEEFDNSSTANINITENSTSILTKEHQEIDTTETFTTTDSGNINQETPLEVEESIEDVIKSTMKEENVTIKSTTKDQQNERYSSILNNETTSTTFSSPIDKPVCHEGECKNLASKILFYMNHTIDPCEDFYEYACGNFENNPQIVEWNLEDAAYQRILGQMLEENEKNISSIFTTYYNSCMQYESVNRTERIKLAREALDKVGKFYTEETWPENHISLTELLATLLLKNSALLFDIVPDLNEYSSTFTLKISPTTYDDLFEIDENNELCYANKLKRENETVNLEELYTEYETCKVDTKRLIKSVSESLTMLGIFNELNNTYNISQYMNFTIINIDLYILQQFFANFPSKNKIREAVLMKNYTLVTVKQLDSEFKIINWSHLIYLLTNEKVKPEVKVQVYFYDALSKGLKNLERLEEEDPMTLHNALLGLYVRNLYHKLIISKHPDVEKHCLRVATNVLIPEASNLYISSFTNDQLTYMNETIHSLFETLKETLKLKLTDVTWITEAERNASIAKINNLNVVVPDISYYTDSKSTYRKILANQINLTNNYFENSVILMQRYRKLIYAELFTNPGHSAQIWTHYATPYQSKGLAIYGLNLVVIPYGVIDWSMKYNESSFNYIKLATLGNIIAHQIAHHFDANGIYYWNGNRNASSLLNDGDSTNMNFKDYIDYQRNVLYKNSMAMTLPFTGQNVLYKISQLTLNERLSEAMGLRLAYDTLTQLMSKESWLYLPWLELDFNKLFYLIYAQMYCTKTPLTSSYISLYENEQLPNRIHIFVSASNNRLLGETWNCPEGSRIMPSYVCSAFPYIQCNEEATIT